MTNQNEPQHILLGLGHRMQVGKDTFAAVLMESHLYTRVAMADILKSFAAVAIPEVGKILDEKGSWEEAKKVAMVRAALQRVGVAGREIINDNVWVDAAMKVADEARINGPVVITDVRFPNEAAAIKRRGGVMLRIDRYGIPRNDHISELALAEWDGWNAVVENSGSLGDFTEEALRWHQKLLTADSTKK